MKLKAIFFAGLSISTLCFIASPLPASADMQRDLENDGYTCRPTSDQIAADRCTKAGSPSYVCAPNACFIELKEVQVPNNNPKGRFTKFTGKEPLQVQTGK
jgi:hypothetical protein